MSIVGKLLRYTRASGDGSRFIRSIIGSGGLRLAGMLFSFFVGIQLARGLGAEGFGIYGLALSVMAILSVPIQFGMPQLLTREVASTQASRDWGRLRGVLRWARRNVLIAAGVTLILTPLVLIVFGYELDSVFSATLIAALVTGVFTALGNIYGAALRGLQHIVKGQLGEVVLRPAIHSLLLMVVMLLAMPMGPELAMWLGALAALVAVVVSFLLLQRTIPLSVSVARPVEDKRHWWGAAIPMAATEGLRILQGHMMIILLGWMVTASELGIYRVAISVALMIMVPLALFNVVNAPLIARAHTQGKRDRIQRLLSWSAVGMAGGTLFLLLPFYIAGESLLAWVFGEEFRSANSVLLILGVGVVMQGALGSNATLLNMTGHHARVTRASAISIVLLLVIAVPMVQFLGIEGAALAYTLAMFSWSLIMWNDARTKLSLDTSLIPVLGFRSKDK